MKFCINCSKELPDNCKFCPNCGTPAPKEQKTDDFMSDSNQTADSERTENSGSYNTGTFYQDPQYNSHSAAPSGPSSSKTHGLVIAGFVTGIAGIYLCWIPIFSVIISLAALGLSIAGFIITNSKGLKKPFALAALIISIVASVASIVLTIALMAYTVTELLPYGYSYNNGYIHDFDYIFGDHFNA